MAYDKMREKTTNVGGVIKRIWYAMTGATQGAELMSIDEAGKFKCVSEQITGLAGTGSRTVVADATGNLSAGNNKIDYTPHIGSVVGSITSYTLITANYTQISSLMLVNVYFVINDKGSATGEIAVSMPKTPALPNAGVGANDTTGEALTTVVRGANGYIRKYNGTSPVSNSEFIVSFSYYV